MKLLDPHFKKLSKDKKRFLAFIGAGYLIVAVLTYYFSVTTLLESFLIFVIGIIYTDLLKLNYRIEKLEKKKR